MRTDADGVMSTIVDSLYTLGGSLPAFSKQQVSPCNVVDPLQMSSNQVRPTFAFVGFFPSLKPGHP